MSQEEMLPVLAREGELAVVLVDGQPVVTARALARALGYTSEKAVLMIVSRNHESFKEPQRGYQTVTPFDTTVVELQTPGGPQKIRVFTKRGALKICMKSNQPKAVMVQEMLIDLYEAVEAKRLVPVEVLRDVERRLDELTAEVRRLALAQEKKIIFLPRRQKPYSTDVEAMEFICRLFAERPGMPRKDALVIVREEAARRGWRIGSRATMYRIMKRLLGS